MARSWCKVLVELPYLMRLKDLFKKKKQPSTDVKWSFLLLFQEEWGYPQIFVEWIEAFVLQQDFLSQLMGQLFGYFKGVHKIRKGVITYQFATPNIKEDLDLRICDHGTKPVSYNTCEHSLLKLVLYRSHGHKVIFLEWESFNYLKLQLDLEGVVTNA